MGLPEPLTRRKRRTRLTPERERELYGRTLDLVRDVGYETMTLDAVAAESRCSKATLYRQWGSKPRLVSEALREMRPFSLEDLDTGSLRGDLHALAQRIGEARKDLDLVRGISLAIRKDAELADAVHEALVQPELDLFEAMLARAAERGEIDRSAPPAVSFRTCSSAPSSPGRSLSGRRPTPNISSATWTPSSSPCC